MLVIEHIQHAPSQKMKCDYLYGWIEKKMVVYAKISPKMVNSRDIARNAEEDFDHWYEKISVRI